MKIQRFSRFTLIAENTTGIWKFTRLLNMPFFYSSSILFFCLHLIFVLIAKTISKTINNYASNKTVFLAISPGKPTGWSKAALELHVDRDLQLSDIECMEGLQRDLSAKTLYYEKVIRIATILSRFLTDYLVLKGPNALHIQKSIRIHSKLTLVSLITKMEAIILYGNSQILDVALFILHKLPLQCFML